MEEKQKPNPLPWVFAGFLVVLGILIYVCLVGYSFSAYICFGLAALVVCYRLLAILGRQHLTVAKAFRTILSICVCLGLLLATVTGVLIGHASLGDPEADCDYIIVLGCGVHGTRPSLSLKNRIDGAYAYLISHPDTICVVSGGQGNGEDISEAECMFRELTAMGIAPERIWLEDKSTSTAENLRFSTAVIEQRTGSVPTEVGIVSSEYHLYRAGRMAEALGLTACGIPGNTTMISLRINYFLREIVAVWYYELFGGLFGGIT